jgi:pimeloyl-ACP methyl ester carboxylesterase
MRLGNRYSPEPKRACAIHKKTEDIRNRAIHFAKDFGWASLAIDAPGHGDRVSREEAETERREAQARIRGGADAPSMGPEDKIRYLDTLAAQAVREWQVALDAALGTDILGDIEAIAYWGVSMGTWIGVPLLATETRFQCAVLGLSQLHPDHSEFRKAAERITIPLRFAFQWDDPIRSRKYGIDLFNALAVQTSRCIPTPVAMRKSRQLKLARGTISSSVT